MIVPLWVAIACLFVGSTLGVLAMAILSCAKGDDVPVAWQYRPSGSHWAYKVRIRPVDPSDGYEVVPLYTHPERNR